MHPSLAWAVVLILGAGCLSAAPPSPAPDAGPDPTLDPPALSSSISVDAEAERLRTELEQVRFGPGILVDAQRSGGEPALVATPKGTLILAAHAGMTLFHPGAATLPRAADLIAPYGGEVFVWRSTDAGKTWEFLALAPTIGPRGTGPSYSDPDLTVLQDGTVCLTALLPFAASPTSCSADQGATWSLPSNPHRGWQDRPFVGSAGNRLFFFASTPSPTGPAPEPTALYVSADRGATWGKTNSPGCGDIAGTPDGLLVTPCGLSVDAGATWQPLGPRLAQYPKEAMFPTITEPAVGSRGHVWLLQGASFHHLWMDGLVLPSPNFTRTIDLGRAFTAFAQVQGHPGNGTFLFPWIRAGAEGRVAVAFLGSYEWVPEVASMRADDDTEWHLFAAHIARAHTDNPLIQITQVSQKPVHRGGVCVGTGCQAAPALSGESGDRRLGDFFEATIDGEGMLNIAVPSTTAVEGSPVSRVLFYRQTAGLPLWTDAGSFPNQG